MKPHILALRGFAPEFLLATLLYSQKQWLPVSEVSATMTKTNFLRGVGMGIAVGAAVGAMMPTHRKRKRSSAARAIKAVTDVMDNLSDAMGL